MAAVLALAGCGEKGAGVGFTSSQSRTTEQAGLIERVKSMLFDKSTTASVQIPVAPLIMQAITDYGIRGEVASGAAILFCSKSILGGIANEVGALPDPSMGATALGLMLEVVKSGLAAEDERWMKAAIERTKNVDKVEAQKLCLSHLVGSATTPVMGWPAASGNVSQREMLRREAEMASVALFATNYVATQIAGQIVNHVYDDPDAIKSMVVKLMDVLAKAGAINTALRQSVKDWDEAKNSLSFDMTGNSPAKTHFIAG